MLDVLQGQGGILARLCDDAWLGPGAQSPKHQEVWVALARLVVLQWYMTLYGILQ